MTQVFFFVFEAPLANGYIVIFFMSVKFSLLCARRVYEYVVVRGRCVTAVRRNHSRYSMNSMC